MTTPLSDASRVLGERLRDRRLVLGVSQEEIAHLAGLNVSNFGKIERGISNPTLHTIVRVASVLDIDPGELIAGLTGADLPHKPETFTASDFVREREARRLG